MISRFRCPESDGGAIIWDGRIEQRENDVEIIQEYVWIGFCRNPEHLATQARSAADTNAICKYCHRRLKLLTSSSSYTLVASSVDTFVDAEEQELFMFSMNITIRRHCYQHTSQLFKERYLRY